MRKTFGNSRTLWYNIRDERRRGDVSTPSVMQEVFIIKEKVASIINSSIEEYNVFVSDAFKEIVEGKTVFNIVLDSSEVIDLNKITEVSRIINDIMDNTEEIEQDYDELDIYSEEKGESIDEQ